MNAAVLRMQLICVLARASGPVTTSAARIALSDKRCGRERPIVAEELSAAWSSWRTGASYAGCVINQAGLPTGN
ncbi:hypothetical protein [Mycobacterium asiaticum]|uniref:Uncharacterized protein n=1 Tax=Mycobacterium asiaticum TaxID=1790 RepID=A0A1A3KYR8_MYCAS|nr:hypothetical protein [Mycobacterium asiaticum]OBJ90372.1 hypothetical protein A5640_24800 [Mycobacterium asiaticum]